MKEIKLSCGKITFVDDDDYLNQWKWRACINGKSIYAQRVEGKKKIKMHRVIMNPEPHLLVDHIDGNGLNNTRNNLRVCTKAENNRNRRVSSNNILGHKGITKDGKSYRARIVVNYKTISLKNHKTLEEAIDAYNKAASIAFGAFFNPSK